MSTVTVTDESFDKDVLQASKPVLVDFWAEWCGPCKQIAPALEQIASELGEQVTVAKLNIEDSPTTPSRYGVRGIPTMMLFKGGQMALSPSANIATFLSARFDFANDGKKPSQSSCKSPIPVVDVPRIKYL